MNNFLKFTGIVIGLTIFAWILSIWYNVFIVGRYYANGNILNNLLVGGIPVWLVIGIYFGYKAVKKL